MVLIIYWLLQEQQRGYSIAQVLVFQTLLPRLFLTLEHPYSKREVQAMQELFLEVISTASSAQS